MDLYHNKTVVVLRADDIPLPDFYQKAYKKHLATVQATTKPKILTPRILKPSSAVSADLHSLVLKQPQPLTSTPSNINELDLLFSSSQPPSAKPSPVTAVHAQPEPSDQTQKSQQPPPAHKKTVSAQPADLDFEGPSQGSNFAEELDFLLKEFA
jgi:hypothetical protein